MCLITHTGSFLRHACEGVRPLSIMCKKGKRVKSYFLFCFTLIVFYYAGLRSCYAPVLINRADSSQRIILLGRDHEGIYHLYGPGVDGKDHDYRIEDYIRIRSGAWHVFLKSVDSSGCYLAITPHTLDLSQPWRVKLGAEDPITRAIQLQAQELLFIICDTCDTSPA
jgi:hypothetical protein